MLQNVPGFRTNKRWKKVLSVIIYSVFILSILIIIPQEPTLLDKVMNLILMIFLFLLFGLPITYGKTKNKYFPWGRKSKKARILSIISFLFIGLFFFGELAGIKSPEKQMIEKNQQALAAQVQGKAEGDAKAKAEAEAKAKAEVDAKAKAEADAKAKAEADAKTKADADAKTKADADAKAKADADAKAKADADAKAKEEVDAKAKSEAAAKTKADADVQAKVAMVEPSNNDVNDTRSTSQHDNSTQTDVKIVSVTSPAARNSTATIVAKVKPNATAYIEVDYKSGPSKAAGLQSKQADANGNVSWSWHVGGNTTLGNWPITVTCDGKSASIQFKVVH